METLEFCDLVRIQRKKVGKTLEEIAQIVGVSRATVQRWESGEIKDIRRDKIVKLAQALETTPDYLMNWDRFTWHDDLYDDYWKASDEDRLQMLIENGIDYRLQTEYVRLTGKRAAVQAFHLSDHEKALIAAYRAHPEMHDAVCTLLGLVTPAALSKNA